MRGGFLYTRTQQLVCTSSGALVLYLLLRRPPSSSILFVISCALLRQFACKTPLQLLTRRGGHGGPPTPAGAPEHQRPSYTVRTGARPAPRAVALTQSHAPTRSYKAQLAGLDTPRVLGCLLGSHTARTLEISNSFEIKYDGFVNGVPQLDSAFLTQKQEQCAPRQRACGLRT